MYDFTFKGINSRDLGITVNRRPPRESANTRSTITEIDGVDGGYIEKVGLNTYVMEFDMTVEGLHNVEKITGWLQGQGEFRRSDVPGKALWVEHQAPLEFEYLTDELYTCTTTFYVVDPTWYLVEDDWHEPWGKNLIPNGWDSFEPYGYEGKETRAPLEVFEKGYTKNLLTGSGQTITTSRYNIKEYPLEEELKDGDVVTITLKADLGEDRTYFGIYNSGGNVSVGSLGNSSLGKDGIYRLTTTWKTGSSTNKFLRLYHMTGSSKSESTVYWIKLDRGENISKWTPSWEDIPEENKPVRAWDNMVVHYTPLGNGLTRIQTWGGNHNLKLYFPSGLMNDKTYSSSIYVENIGEYDLRVENNGYGLNEKVEKGVKAYIEKTGTGSGNSYLNFSIRTYDVNHSLDFTASDPKIVEGDKPASWNADENPRIVNEGNYKSKPIIKLEKGTSKYVDVLVNKTRFVYEFKDNDKFVIIDCENQTAVDEQGRNRIRNLKIGYEFPTLRPGPNTVRIIDGDAKISFRRKDRWR